MNNKSRSVLVAAIVAAVAAVSAIGLYAYNTSSASGKSNGSTTTTPTQQTIPSGTLTEAGPFDMNLLQNYTTLNVARGASVSGAIRLQVFSNKPMIVTINDLRLNSSNINSESTLPSGISVSLNLPGQTYVPEFTSKLDATGQDIGTIPTIKLAGNATIPYTISADSTVPPGKYSVKIGMLTLVPVPGNPSKVGTHEGRVYEVSLNVV